MWKSRFYGAFVLNHRVVLHAIDATPARWRGDAGSSPLDRARSAASSPRSDLVKNRRVHPTHWLISTQVPVFSDLVAVIGALTSGPLGFALPALLFDLATRDSDVKRRRKGVVSLVLFTVVLTIAGTTGAVIRTVEDWEAQERSAPGVRGFFCAEQASSMS